MGDFDDRATASGNLGADIGERNGYGTRDDVLELAGGAVFNNYMNPLMIEDLLPVAHLSRSHFHAIFAEEAGCTFKDYLNRVRIGQAERMLLGSDIPIIQVALGCGFNCLSHFYAVFRRMKGQSPQAFAKRNRKTGTRSHA